MGKIKIKKTDVWIDMTPMSDVMVLLLTFFMLSANFTKNEVVKVVTPGSTTMAKVSSSAVLDITIDPEGRVLMATDKTVTLEKALEQMLKERETTLTPEQKKEFLVSPQVGIPVKSLPEFLGRTHEDQVKLLEVEVEDSRIFMYDQCFYNRAVDVLEKTRDLEAVKALAEAYFSMQRSAEPLIEILSDGKNRVIRELPI
jgi:biopolymer transport protein ExbD